LELEDLSLQNLDLEEELKSSEPLDLIRDPKLLVESARIQSGCI